MSTSQTSRAILWAGFHLRRHFRKAGTLLWLLGIVVVAAVLRIAGAPPVRIVDLVLLYVVPLAAVTFGSAALREEVEDQTLTYGFSRAVDRGLLYLGRVAAAIGVVSVLGLVGTAVGASEPIAALRNAGITLAAATAYTAAFGVVGVVLSRPVWFGIVFVLAWEQGLGAVPGFLSQLTLRTHLRNLSGLRPDGPLLSGLWSPPATWVSVVVLVAVTAVALAVGIAIARRREFVISR